MRPVPKEESVSAAVGSLTMLAGMLTAFVAGKGLDVKAAGPVRRRAAERLDLDTTGVFNAVVLDPAAPDAAVLPPADPDAVDPDAVVPDVAADPHAAAATTDFLLAGGG